MGQFRRAGLLAAATLLFAAPILTCTACGTHRHTATSTPLLLPLLAPVQRESGSAATLPPVPWHPPAAAVATARRYVTAALSDSWRRPPNAWIDQVRPICTPQWAAAISDSADGGGGGWAAVVAAHQVAGAAVTAVYPSAGPGPGRRLEVTAVVTVTLGDSRPSTHPAVLAVDLLSQPDGTWLVGWAG